MRAQKMFVMIALAFAVATTAAADQGFETLDFPTANGIEARADFYGKKDGTAPLIVLFHQAGWSRGEYRDIAPKLEKAGYRVLAVDQRSGRGVNGVANVTSKRAKRKKLPSGYLDAYADLVAALDYAKANLNAPQAIVWGSSYSASLVIRLAAEESSRVRAVLSFSPGEYFKKAEGPDYVQRHAKQVKQPLFVTSSKTEREQVKPLFDAAPAENKILFTPASAGRHGSRALWSKSPDNDVYWAAVNGFLQTYAPAK
jgi:pimeloyl-ACP methyl ester carboxylesterase